MRNCQLLGRFLLNLFGNKKLKREENKVSYCFIDCFD
jgi:hypothetical protein